VAAAVRWYEQHSPLNLSTESDPSNQKSTIFGL